MASDFRTPVLVVAVKTLEDFMMRQTILLFDGDTLRRPGLMNHVVVLPEYTLLAHTPACARVFWTANLIIADGDRVVDIVPIRNTSAPDLGADIAPRQTHPIVATLAFSWASFSAAESCMAFFSFSRAIFCCSNSEASSLA